MGKRIGERVKRDTHHRVRTSKVGILLPKLRVRGARCFGECVLRGVCMYGGSLCCRRDGGTGGREEYGDFFPRSPGDSRGRKGGG